MPRFSNRKFYHFNLNSFSGPSSMNISSPMKEPKNQPKILFHASKPGQEMNVKLYHKLIDGWAVEIIEVNILLRSTIILGINILLKAYLL